MEVLQRLVDAGNTVIVIEHNLDVIQCADHIIDLGPEGGDGGGELSLPARRRNAPRAPASFTGEFLKPALSATGSEPFPRISHRICRRDGGMGKWILAFLIAAAVLFLCWKLRGVMLTPVCRGKGQSLELILRVSGASPELEATVDGLLWLINDGVLFGRIVLLDDGMDEETREIARHLSLGQGNVTLWTKQTNSAAPCSSSEP